MSSFTKMLSVLDLFTTEKSVWTAEEIVEKMKLTKPTGYRYVRELNNVGLLARISGGYYILGPKLIELDYRIRSSDPTITAGREIMRELLKKTGCDVLLSSIYNNQILNIYEERTAESFDISFARGKPHPLAKGSTSKIILAYLPQTQIKKIYEQNREEFARGGMGEDWDRFRSCLASLRKKGYAISYGELDADLTGIAAPIFLQNSVRGSLTLVVSTERFVLFHQDKLVEMLLHAANRISKLISDNW